MAPLVIDTPGRHVVDGMTAGLVARAGQAIEVTAPDVELVVDGAGLERAESDPQGDGDWSAFIRVRSSAARCRVVDSRLDDIDTIAIHVAAPFFELRGSSITNMGAGVFLDGAAAKTARIVDSAIHKANRPLRSTVGGSDDTGAMCVVFKNTPRVSTPAERHRVERCYLGDAMTYVEDYGWNEGAGVEGYQASSFEVVDSVILDVSVALETGSKSPNQVYDLHFVDTYIGALETVNDDRYRRGLGFRPVSGARVTRCAFFDLDHWNGVVGWPSGTFAYGVNADFVWSGNRHACSRNNKAVTYGGAGGTGYTVDAATEIVRFGADAYPLASQLRAEAIARRDLILQLAGLKTEPTPVLEARVAILEAQIADALELAQSAADTGTAAQGMVAELRTRLDTLETRLESAADALDG